LLLSSDHACKPTTLQNESTLDSIPPPNSDHSFATISAPIETASAMKRQEFR
jgi:hypothetical protein